MMKTVHAIALATVAGTVCSAAWAAGSDDLWEMNITLKSEFQNTVMQPMKNCMPKNSPIPHDKNCKVTTSGGLLGKVTAVTECPGPPPSTIKFEGTRTASTMQGTMTVISSGTTMVQEFTGKVIGSCDAATYNGSAAMGSMPAGGMNMPSFDPSSLPSRRQKAAAAAAAAEAHPAAQAAPEAPAAPAQDAANPLDAAKKALGSFLHF